jgi:hypothetical protein
MGDMSEEQERGLEEFKRFLTDIQVPIGSNLMYDDYYLLRFLRARKFDQEKTKLMFNNFLQWRIDNQVDNILDVRPSLMIIACDGIGFYI